jgi:RIO kinase 1
VTRYLRSDDYSDDSLDDDLLDDDRLDDGPGRSGAARRSRGGRWIEPEDDPAHRRRRRPPGDRPEGTGTQPSGTQPSGTQPSGTRRADADGDDTAWSTWDVASRGPRPYPAWLVTELAAVDTDLGVLKTGKEADVHLLERAVPGTGRRCLLAAKRYRGSDHRLFHRDAAYLEGRRVRRSRETRAMATRTGFGRDLLAGRWAAAEFGALCRLWSRGAPVPYPVQLHGTELLLEYLDEPDGTAAPRLAQLRPDDEPLGALWEQLIAALLVLAAEGVAHGDLSPFNVLVHRDRLVLIDFPQVVDVVANPRGREFLARDVTTMCRWFLARGLPAERADPAAVLAMLCAEAGIDEPPA